MWLFSLVLTKHLPARDTALTPCPRTRGRTSPQPQVARYRCSTWSAAAFRGLIDAAADLGGSYFLTYHTWASMEQVLRCYPRFGEFLAKKREYDPGEVFQSEWYRHYRGLR